MAHVLVVEPWYGGSHRAWADGWKSASRHHIELVTAPDRFWRWRLRGGAVELAARVRDRLAAAPVDLVVVSSMVDVASLAGLTRRALGDTPLVTYMHENQLLYPLAPNQRPDPSLGLIGWRSVVAADEVWWNSAFHRDAFIDATVEMLGRQPEATPGARVDQVRRVSRVLPPGVETRELIGRGRELRSRPLVVWNQRWDHDKNPAAVFGALARLCGAGVDFDLALAGENPGHGDHLASMLARLSHRIVHHGWLDRADYLDLLASSDVVASAADHEFFGIAIVEAMAAGAVPVLPDRLSFPELVGAEWAPAVLYPDGGLDTRLRDVLSDIEGARSQIAGLRESMVRYDVVTASADHDLAVDGLVESGPTR